jgi:CHC2 zinc finger
MTAAASHAWVEQARSVPIEDELARRGIKLARRGSELIGPCPRCGGDDRFGVNIVKQIFNCRGCGKGGDIIDLVQHLDGVDFTTACTKLAGDRSAKGNGKDEPAAEPKKVVAAKYRYEDEAGNLLFEVLRIEYQNAAGSFVLNDGKHKKTFRQRRPDPEQPSKWIWNLDGVRTVPYQLPQLLEAVGNGYSVLIVEGEAKADLLWSWNAPATCCAGGAGKWTATHAEYLAGARKCRCFDLQDDRH